MKTGSATPYSNIYSHVILLFVTYRTTTPGTFIRMYFNQIMPGERFISLINVRHTYTINQILLSLSSGSPFKCCEVNIFLSYNRAKFPFLGQRSYFCSIRQRRNFNVIIFCVYLTCQHYGLKLSKSLDPITALNKFAYLLSCFPADALKLRTFHE